MTTTYFSFSFNGSWDESNQNVINEWLIKKWTETTGEAPEQDFLEYIVVMIKNQKNMEEICHELKDLGVEEPNASTFVNELGEMLTNLSNSTSDSEVKEIPASLKSTTNDSSKKSLNNGALSGSSRLLNSALQSSRATVKQTDNNSSQKRQQSGNVGVKRTANDSDNKTSYRNIVMGGEGHANQAQFNNKHYRPNSNIQQPFNQPQQQHFQSPIHQVPFHQPPHHQPPYPPTPNAAPVGAGPGLDTVKYFEQMNAVAQMSGFRNAQEMLASQREMMALMSHGPAALGGPVAPQHPPLPAAPAPQQHFPQPPYPAHPVAVEGAPTVDASVYPPASGYRGGRGAGRGYQGRGFVPGYRGRGGFVPGAGRGFHPAAAGGVAPVAVDGQVPVPAAPTDGSVPPTAVPSGLQTGPGFGGYRGRGGAPWRGAPGRGRGAGRGAPFVAADGSTTTAAAVAGGNKVWVREANIDSSLVSSR